MELLFVNCTNEIPVAATAETKVNCKSSHQEYIKYQHHNEKNNINAHFVAKAKMFRHMLKCTIGGII